MYRINLEENPKVKAKLRTLLGADFDLNKLAVFEALANDSLNFGNAGGFYNNGRMSEDYLNQMGQAILTGQYVPVIEQHETDGKLPVGRVFEAGLFDNEETKSKDLHLLLYIDSEAEANLVAKLESGSVNEVSTGTSPSGLQCSDCGFDFLASAQNRQLLYSGYRIVKDERANVEFKQRTYSPMCDKGHLWGDNGNHLVLSGLKKFQEISLVTRGAVTRARVLNKETVKLSVSEGINLAQHEDNDTLRLVTLSDANSFGGESDILQHKGDDVKEISLALADYDSLVLKAGKVQDTETQLTAAQSELTQLKSELAEAKAEADKTAELQTKLDEKETECTELQTKLNLALAGVKPNGNSDPENEGGAAKAPALPDHMFKQAK